MLKFDKSYFRNKHFEEKPGRPPLSLIYKEVWGMAESVKKNVTSKDWFISDDICCSFWDAYPDQHQYIGHHLSKMEKMEILPIKRVDIRNKRVLYSIII